MIRISPNIRSIRQSWFLAPVICGHWKQILFLAIITIMVRVPYFFWPMISDEGGYAYTADWWFRGLTLYSDDLWFDRPQGIFLAYKMGMLVFGGSTIAIRLWGAIWTACTTIIIYLICLRLFESKTAGFSGLLYGLVSTMPQFEGFTANAEVFATCAASASLFMALRKHWFISGMLTTAAFLLKPSGVTIALVTFYLLFYHHELLSAWLKYALGCGIVLFAAGLQAVISVGLKDYLFAVFQFRLNTLSPQPGMQFLESVQLTGLAWIPLALVSIPAILRFKDKAIRVLLIWVISAFLGMSVSSYWNLHYYIQLIPPLVISATVGLIGSHSRVRGSVGSPKVLLCLLHC